MLNELEYRFYDLAASFPSIKKELPRYTSLADIGPVLALLTDLNHAIHGVGKPGAARFLLSIWHGDKIDVRFREAWCAWDAEHRRAWQAWARDPWWA